MFKVARSTQLSIHRVRYVSIKESQAFFAERTCLRVSNRYLHPRPSPLRLLLLFFFRRATTNRRPGDSYTQNKQTHVRELHTHSEKSKSRQSEGTSLPLSQADDFEAPYRSNGSAHRETPVVNYCERALSSERTKQHSRETLIQQFLQSLPPRRGSRRTSRLRGRRCLSRRKNIEYKHCRCILFMRG